MNQVVCWALACADVWVRGFVVVLKNGQEHIAFLEAKYMLLGSMNTSKDIDGHPSPGYCCLYLLGGSN